jgi:hypothetical protein
MAHACYQNFITENYKRNSLKSSLPIPFPSILIVIIIPVFGKQKR